jgi:MYXO-CTERM domain-containing protein
MHRGLPTTGLDGAEGLGWGVLAAGMCLLALTVAGSAWGTTAFDPTTAAATFDETHPVSQDLDGLPVWDRVERHVDGDTVLFLQEDFAPGWAWDDSSPASPQVATAFAHTTPHSGTFLLHFAPGWALADEPYPVLLVPGAAVSASGVMPPLARFLAAQGRSVFAVTFAHPHGDCYQQAEQVANAVARILEVTGAEKVDIIGHSKGGIAAALYAANHLGADWSAHDDDRGARYAARGTPYRGDVRRLITSGTPLGGGDTAFRWTSQHLFTGQGEDPLISCPWETYYPYTSANLLVSEDLRAVDLWPDYSDAWPGQRQLLRDWEGEYGLPGADVQLGVYALQQDWWTTYHGGLGLYSYARGLDDAVDESGRLLDKLAAAGIDPGVELAVLAGTNPLIWIDGRETLVDIWGEGLGDFLGQSSAFYAQFLNEIIGPRFQGFELTDEEQYGVGQGHLMFGEISGQSDGVIFTASATDHGGLLTRGATLLEVRETDLAHMDLIFAGEEMGQWLIDQGDADEAQRHLRALGQRYLAEDSFGWYEEMLSDGDEPGDDDTGDDDTAGDDDGGDDDGGDDDSDEVIDDDDGPWDGACDCQADTAPGQAAAGWVTLAAITLILGRRRRA